MENCDIREFLTHFAEKYENISFLDEDPSRFMHQVSGTKNQETTAFIASALSYGNRMQFCKKISTILTYADYDTFKWIVNRDYLSDFPDNNTSFYRLYTSRHLRLFLRRIEDMLKEFGSIGEFAKVKVCDQNPLSIIEAITDYFKDIDSPVIPKSTSSACKRLCMFLRWMIRDNSPVDLGLWSEFADKRKLIIPMDTHVLTQARRLGLISSRTASMAAAIKLSNTLATVFPYDPMKGDFALFGYGVSVGNDK